jgi:hypothetical protein
VLNFVLENVDFGEVVNSMDGKKRIQTLAVFFLFLTPLLPVCSGFSDSMDKSQITLTFDGKVNDEGVPAPWDLSIKKGKAYTKVISENGDHFLHMKSTKSSFALERELAVDASEYPYVTWTWKALTLPQEGDVREKGHNDQALQFIIGFKGDRALGYIWDTNAPPGTIVNESYPWPIGLTVKVIVVNSGTSETGKWLTLTRNLHADYKNLFGEAPPRMEGVRLQMNTQHTGGSAEGFFGKIIFRKTPL